MMALSWLRATVPAQREAIADRVVERRAELSDPPDGDVRSRVLAARRLLWPEFDRGAFP